MARSGAESGPGHANGHAKLGPGNRVYAYTRAVGATVAGALAHHRRGPLKVYSLRDGRRGSRRLSRTRAVGSACPSNGYHEAINFIIPSH